MVMSKRIVMKMMKQKAGLLMGGAFCALAGAVTAGVHLSGLESQFGSLPVLPNLFAAGSMVLSTEGLAEAGNVLMKAMASRKTWRKIRRTLKNCLRLILGGTAVCFAVWKLWNDAGAQAVLGTLKEEIWTIVGFCFMLYGLGIILHFVIRWVFGWLMKDGMKIAVYLGLGGVCWYIAKSGFMGMF